MSSSVSEKPPAAGRQLVQLGDVAAANDDASSSKTKMNLIGEMPEQQYDERFAPMSATALSLRSDDVSSEALRNARGCASHTAPEACQACAGEVPSCKDPARFARGYLKARHHQAVVPPLRSLSIGRRE